MLSHRTSRLTVSELLLGLALKLRFRQLDADDCSQTFPDILAA